MVFRSLHARKVLSSWFRVSVIFVAIFSLILSTVSPVYATVKLPTGREDEWGENDILFYDPDGSLSPNSTNPNCTSTAPTGDKITLIGDSLSEGALSEFDSQIPGIDHSDKTYYGTTYKLVRYSKSWMYDPDSGENHSGLTIAQQLKDNGELRSFLVFALGTNDSWRLKDSHVDDLIDIVGTETKIVLVTNANDGGGTPDFENNNKVIREAAQRYSNIVVADWEEAIKDDISTYINDSSLHVHLSAQGNQLFVATIKEALAKFGGGGISSGSSSSSADTSGAIDESKNVNYAGVQVWQDSELELIRQNLPFYSAAAAKYNFPWQLLATFHSLEYGNKRANPANGQGAYQLYSYTAGGTNSNAFLPAGPISDEEFQRQSDIAASIIRDTMDRYGLSPENDDDMKQLFFRYNGTAQVYKDKAIAMGFTQEQANNGEGSAYVMNRYDARRDPTSSQMDPNWPGRFTGDGHYDSSSTSSGFGAFVKYAALGGSTGGSWQCVSSVNGGGSIVETAILLSWEGHGHAKDDPKPEYVEAMKQVGTYVQGCNSSGCAPYGASCDQFVSTVMRFSGSDPEFPTFSGGGTQLSHLVNSGKYVEVQHGGDISNLQPGDILVTSGSAGYHIYINLGDIKGDGKLWQASASFNGRTGEHYQGVYLHENWNGGRDYRAFRRVG